MHGNFSEPILTYYDAKSHTYYYQKAVVSFKSSFFILVCIHKNRFVAFVIDVRVVETSLACRDNAYSFAVL